MNQQLIHWRFWESKLEVPLYLISNKIFKLLSRVPLCTTEELLLDVLLHLCQENINTAEFPHHHILRLPCERFLYWIFGQSGDTETFRREFSDLISTKSASLTLTYEYLQQATGSIKNYTCASGHLCLTGVHIYLFHCQFIVVLWSNSIFFWLLLPNLANRKEVWPSKTILHQTAMYYAKVDANINYSYSQQCACTTSIPNKKNRVKV